ncbi:MAG: translation elongation factor Ts [Deltaproteobacteria bacterium]|nr:translation elongation factor Ts [Deltaproteobacteria bacterium]
MITAEQVRGLREKTGAGIMDCKKALAESKGDMETALTYLREKGLATARKKADRKADEGCIGAYIHAGGKVGVLVEINCETDFVARNENFQALVKDIAMHIAAMNPIYVRRTDVPACVIENERKIMRAEAIASGKPEKVRGKIVDGKVEKFLEDVCLLEQYFVKNPDLTIEKLVTESVAKLGENISVKRFSRFKIGEDAEKQDDKTHI